MKEEDKAFLAGIAVGIFVFALALIVCGLTPKAMNADFRNQAVVNGVAEWIIETNESGEPEMKFQWKQLK